MEPITNSIIKENIRRKNEEEARKQEAEIRRKSTESINEIGQKSQSGCLIYVLIMIAACYITGLLGIIWILPGGILVCVLVYYGKQGSAETSKGNVQNSTEARIREVYRQADIKTRQEIAAYDSDVKAFHDQVMRNTKNIHGMAEHCVMMFERMISHSDNRSHKAFVEADLNYIVKRDGIIYIYDKSKYQNPLDDYDFDVNRFRRLTTDAQCEGLAQALARMIVGRMRQKYPPNSIHIKVSHNDANVTLHFAGNNPNYVPPKDIGR